jgi:hypothetical protein
MSLIDVRGSGFGRYPRTVGFRKECMTAWQ